MHQNPFTAGGYDYSDLSRKIDQKADKHEVYSLSSSVDNLERTLQEVRSENDGLRSRLKRLEEVVREVTANAYNI